MEDISEENISVNTDFNRTLQVLRSKKIKLQDWREEKAEALKVLTTEVKNIVQEAKNNNATGIFLAKKGGLTILPVTQKVHKNIVKHFSTKEIRTLIIEALE